MDVEFLLLLQNFRASIQDGLNPLMETISFFAAYYLLIIPAYVYWCIDKQAGIYTFAAYNAGNVLNSFVKLTVCALRPGFGTRESCPQGIRFAQRPDTHFPAGMP